MKKILCASLIISAAVLTGCSGNVESEPGRWYTDAQPCTAAELAASLPSGAVSQSVTIELYEDKNGQETKVQVKKYEAGTAAAEEIFSQLPVSGRFYADISLDGKYFCSADIDNGIITFVK